MLAQDIMTTNVATVTPKTPVAEIAKLLLDRHISAVPVVDESGSLKGIVSEGDLMRRPESGTEAHHSWWLAFLALPDEDQRRFVKTHGQYAEDVMTRNVATVPPDCPLPEIATLLEDRRIKRAPVVENGKLVGIVSRADLLRGVAASAPMPAPSADDRALRQAVQKAVEQHAGLDNAFIGTTVTGGVARLWGIAQTQAAKDAARVAAENVPGVKSVEDRIGLLPHTVASLLWAE